MVFELQSHCNQNSAFQRQILTPKVTFPLPSAISCTDLRSKIHPVFAILLCNSAFQYQKLRLQMHEPVRNSLHADTIGITQPVAPVLTIRVSFSHLLNS